MRVFWVLWESLIRSFKTNHYSVMCATQRQALLLQRQRKEKVNNSQKIMFGNKTVYNTNISHLKWWIKINKTEQVYIKHIFVNPRHEQILISWHSLTCLTKITKQDLYNWGTTVHAWSLIVRDDVQRQCNDSTSERFIYDESSGFLRLHRAFYKTSLQVNQQLQCLVQWHVYALSINPPPPQKMQLQDNAKEMGLRSQLWSL